MNLRSYQLAARDAVFRSWEKYQSTLLVLPTGCGKTIVFSAITEQIVRNNGRVLIMAHRGELLEQAADKLERVTGMRPAVEKADDTAHDSMAAVTVGSVQTLMRPARLARFAEDHYTHIIIDEAHHALSESYRASVRYFSGAKVLGVTATADRADKRSLGEVFESLAFEYSICQAIRDGFLSKIRAVSVPLNIDLRGVKMQSGDFAAADLDDRLAPYLGAIAEEMIQRCMDHKTLIFVPLVATAVKFAAMLKAAGMNAQHVSGDDPERREKLAWFAKAARGSVMVNSMLLTEGYDCPDIDCIGIYRPTKSRALYAQMVGRGTRPAPGKEDLMLLDFLWMTDRHDLCRPASLVMETPEEVETIREMTEAAGAEGMLIDDVAIEAARGETLRKREEALAKKLEEMRRKKARLVDPLQYAMSIHADGLDNYEPAFAGEAAPITPEQAARLETAGINPDAVTCAGQAEKLIATTENRKAQGLATPKQIRVLERMGFRNVGQAAYAEANKLITRIAGNGWRVPPGMASGWNEKHKTKQECHA